MKSRSGFVIFLLLLGFLFFCVSGVSYGDDLNRELKLLQLDMITLSELWKQQNSEILSLNANLKFYQDFQLDLTVEIETLKRESLGLKMDLSKAQNSLIEYKKESTALSRSREIKIGFIVGGISFSVGVAFGAWIGINIYKLFNK